MMKKLPNKETQVRVAVRVRPLIEKELIENCRTCINVDKTTNQIIIGSKKTFRYDYVFGSDSKQEEIYDGAVKKLVDQVFQGYNATIFAYGQTGSGKTFSMGTAFNTGGVDNGGNYKEAGVIPRVANNIFELIEKKKNETEFLVRVSYLEIYNQKLRDLLNPKVDPKTIKLRETEKGLQILGIKEEFVKNKDELLHSLERGGVHRTTGSTLMNQWSSRSHSIFTVIVEQRMKKDKESPSSSPSQNNNNDDNENNENNEENKENGGEFLMAKFHLVDLAGSERVKKSGAVGVRFKESVAINYGLLALSNVISALGDEKKRKNIKHVPYRSSKLTRLLQDSLGGNSNTLMIACISPADSSFEETLNTLKYANRARNIKNKPIINRDPHAAQLAKLRDKIRQLQLALLQKDQHTLTEEQEEQIRQLARKSLSFDQDNNNFASNNSFFFKSI